MKNNRIRAINGYSWWPMIKWSLFCTTCCGQCLNVVKNAEKQSEFQNIIVKNNDDS